MESKGLKYKNRTSSTGAELKSKDLTGGKVMKISLSAVSTFISLVLTASLFAGTYGGGTGEPNDPYIISDPNHLAEMHVTQEGAYTHFVLLNDIDMTGIVYDSAVIASYGGFDFHGTFDGNGYVIKNLKIDANDTTRESLGFIGSTSEIAKIKNLGLENVMITNGSRDVGALVGSNDGDIDSCWVSGTIEGDTSMGLLFGSIGGLIGANGAHGDITNCYCNVDVVGNRFIGGFIGYNIGDLVNCYSIGRVTGNSDVGGFIGYKYGGSSAVVTGCFWDTEARGMTTSDGGTGKTTAELQDINTFLNAGWDFVGERVNGMEDNWMMTCDGMNYPKLSWWQPESGDYFCPDGVDHFDLIHLTDWWLADCDEDNDYCSWAEISGDYTVDMHDFAVLAENWLMGY